MNKMNTMHGKIRGEEDAQCHIEFRYGTTITTKKGGGRPVFDLVIQLQV